MNSVGRVLAGAALALVIMCVMHAQVRGQNWNTTSADAQRTGWLRTETRISVEALQKPESGGFQLLWKVNPQNQPRQLSTLTQPLILGNLISHKGFKALAFIGGSADIVYAYDYDLARVYLEPAVEHRGDQFEQHTSLSGRPDHDHPQHSTESIGGSLPRRRSWLRAARGRTRATDRNQPGQPPDHERGMGDFERRDGARTQSAHRC